MRSLKKKMKNKMKTMKNIKFNGGMVTQEYNQIATQNHENKYEWAAMQHKGKPTIPIVSPSSSPLYKLPWEEESEMGLGSMRWRMNPENITESLKSDLKKQIYLNVQTPDYIKIYCEKVHTFIDSILGKYQPEDPDYEDPDPIVKNIIVTLLTAKEPNAYVKNALAALLIEICDRPEDQEEGAAAAMDEINFARYWYDKISELSISDKLEQILQLVDVTQHMSKEDNYKFLRNAQRDYNYPLYKGIIIDYEIEKVIAEIIGIIVNIAHEPDVEGLRQLFNRMDLEDLKQHLLTYKKIEKLWKNSKLDKIVIVIGREPNDILRLITHYIRSKSLIELLKNKAGKQELLQRLYLQIQSQGDEFKREMQKLAEKVEICCESKNKGKDQQKRSRDVDNFNQLSSESNVSEQLRTRARVIAPASIPVQRVTTTTIISGLYIARILHFICEYLLLHNYLITPQIFTFMEEMNHALERLNEDDNIIILSSSRFLLNLNLFVKFINENEPFDHHPHVVIEDALRNIAGDEGGAGGAGGRVSP